jgi:lipase chaperone LimK
MDDAQYEQYVKGLGVLTDEELKTLMDTNAQIVKLSDEIDELTTRYASSSDPTEQGDLDNLIHYKQHQIEEATKSIADLDDKVRIVEETNYVMGLSGLTDAARQELQDMYATQRDVEKQLAALEDTLSEAAKAELYGEEG